MAETVGEFFATLGFKIDRAQEARFTDTMANVAKNVAKLSAALTAAATAIQTVVVSVSKSFDDLYFAAQRTNSTVAGIKALSFAFSQVGASGAEAQTAIERLAHGARHARPYPRARSCRGCVPGLCHGERWQGRLQGRGRDDQPRGLFQAGGELP